MVRPEPLAAGFADAFLLGYMAHASDQARPYCEVDVRVVRALLGVVEQTLNRDEQLVESCGCCIVAGIGTVQGGLTILYWNAELGYHHVIVACHPYQMRVTEPTDEDPEF